MRAKSDAFLADLAQLVQAENLEASGISQDRPRPRHETMQPAKLADSFDSGTQVKVVSVAQKNLNPEFFENVLRHALDRRYRADRHEHGGLDFPVRRGQPPGASAPANSLDAKLNGHS